jgi:hypothetical protein
MSQTPREIVSRCLQFKYPDRMPRDLWLLPWAANRYPETVEELNRRFPTDFVTTEYFYSPSPKIKGDPYKAGIYTDEWGCVFENLQDGIIGEVRNPILSDISNWRSVQPPYDQIPKNKSDIQAAYDIINRFYDKTDKFVLANTCPRPWERYQFLRGTEKAMIDVMMPEAGARDLLKVIHDFYLKEIEMWVKSGVDAIGFMDDWGAQNRLLIPPEIWCELFKPLYKEYCDLAKAYDKFVFMHSDGHITDIYDDLIEIGVDALNSQLFCMEIEELEKRAKGKITFWGEIDRQHILPSKDPQVGRDAVQLLMSHLYDPSGGMIAQSEFGAGANPETMISVFEEWEQLDNIARNGGSIN